MREGVGWGNFPPEGAPSVAGFSVCPGVRACVCGLVHRLGRGWGQNLLSLDGGGRSSSVEWVGHPGLDRNALLGVEKQGIGELRSVSKTSAQLSLTPSTCKNLQDTQVPGHPSEMRAQESAFPVSQVMLVLRPTMSPSMSSAWQDPAPLRTCEVALTGWPGFAGLPPCGDPQSGRSLHG